MINSEQETKRLGKEIENLENYLQTMEKKLGNKAFIQNAPQEVVKKEQEKYDEAREKLQKLQKQMKAL